MVGFADDLFRRRLLEDPSASGALGAIQEGDSNMNQALDKWRFRQNMQNTKTSYHVWDPPRKTVAFRKYAL
eukprot:792572-Pyramimonas_sp.AAC.1